ncbi:tetratricopeptide repeat protein [Kineosporia babensis]|uniref:Tetratricopeptide repeat protein n=1 Tax=Kineosporia babensis TaxID=499548 RepID=A0A9X1NNY4_9ACTN|nr:tetratricopeptide repeat protein [Kineosporia babensis]
MKRHHWIHGGRRADRARALSGMNLPPVLAVLDAHRRRRGPYTAAGTLLRQIIDHALQLDPGIGPRHFNEIAIAAPELAHRVPPVLAAFEWSLDREEKTRYYSRLHTFNLANGLAALLRDHLRALGGGPRTLVLENLDEADVTDQEFVAVLLRRTDLPDLTVVACTGTAQVTDPPGELPISLVRELDRCAQARAVTASENIDDGELEEFVEGCCLDDAPGPVARYARLSDEERAALHSAALESVLSAVHEEGEISLGLGAALFHAERAGDERLVNLLREAVRRCREFGLYSAAVELGRRGVSLVDPVADEDVWWEFTHAVAVCLSSLARADEAAEQFQEAAVRSQKHGVHSNITYGMAMLYARYYPEPRRDPRLARMWMNMHIVLTRQVEDPAKRAFESVFAHNGLALIEVREKQPEVALRLLEEGMSRLDAELEPGQYRLHRIVLRYNRAQVLMMSDRTEEALQEYWAVAEADPEFYEHYFQIGNLLRRLGRPAEAVDAYRTALAKSPPFPEAHYNIGDAELTQGRVQPALESFAEAVELDPTRLEAHVSYIELLVEVGRLDAARAALDRALTEIPARPELLTLKAQILSSGAAARQCLDEALHADPRYPQAWAVRAELAYQEGDLAGALADFDAAVALDDQPSFRFNRGVVHQDSGNLTEAAADFAAVLESSADDEALERLHQCTQPSGSVAHAG